ncbi:hypothetical protein [Streptomyces sp. NBC_00859]|uniref:hypothetical protein n=1 Tax=Streptomyces sp. NBC_00859 TaxID=2903682 RepID=UPI00386C8400|nr:hypothetical protein OG584_24800 [Streptomyces sp. NBC_00859]
METPRRARLAALLAALVLTGCSSTHGGSLDAQSGTPSPTCLVHQTKVPASRYTAGSRSDPRSVLELMHYFTANGTKTYCDGKPPTRTDRHWMDLYGKLGGAPGHLAAKGHRAR